MKEWKVKLTCIRQLIFSLRLQFSNNYCLRIWDKRRQRFYFMINSHNVVLLASNFRSLVCRLQKGHCFCGTMTTSRAWSNKTTRSFSRSSSLHLSEMRGPTGTKQCEAWPSMCASSSLTRTRISSTSAWRSSMKQSPRRGRPSQNGRSCGDALRNLLIQILRLKTES